MLHQLRVCDVNSNEEYETFIDLLSNVGNSYMKDPCFQLNLSSKRDHMIKLSSFEDYAIEILLCQIFTTKQPIKQLKSINLY